MRTKAPVSGGENDLIPASSLQDYLILRDHPQSGSALPNHWPGDMAQFYFPLLGQPVSLGLPVGFFPYFGVLGLVLLYVYVTTDHRQIPRVSMHSAK